MMRRWIANSALVVLTVCVGIWILAAGQMQAAVQAQEAPTPLPLSKSLPPITIHNVVLLERLGSFSDGVPAALSPNGQLFATSDFDGMLRIRTVGNNLLFRAIDTTIFQDALVFSPDGSRLAVADWQGFIKIYDVVLGSLLTEIVDLEGRVHDFEFSPDGRRLAVAMAEGDNVFVVASIGDDGEYRQLFRLEGEIPNGVAFSPDGQRLVVADSAFVEVYGVVDEEFYRLANFDVQGHRDAAYAPNGAYFVTTEFDGVTIWNAETLRKQHRIIIGGFELRQAAITADSSLIAVTDDGSSSILFYDPDGYQRHVLVIGGADLFYGVEFNKTGTLLMSANFAGIQFFGVPSR